MAILAKILVELKAQAFFFVPQFVVGLAVFLGFWVAGVTQRALIRRFARQDPENRAVLELLGRSVKIALVIVGAIMSLGTMGIDVSALVAGLGLSGFALGFALKDALSNLLAGVLILVYRPFNRGDTILVNKHEGVVTEIDLRYTTLQGEDRIILIPNATLFRNVISVITTPQMQETDHLGIPKL